MFRGWGYEELAEEWGLHLPEFLEDYSSKSSPGTDDWIKMYLENFMEHNSRVTRKAAKDIREYCKLIDEWCDVTDSSVWRAISKMEHDGDVIVFFTPLIHLAWT